MIEINVSKNSNDIGFCLKTNNTIVFKKLNLIQKSTYVYMSDCLTYTNKSFKKSNTGHVVSILAHDYDF
jgi:hypothetical protein